jgi:hypothetical protein
MSLRVYVVTAEERATFDPQNCVAAMKAAGFTFLSEVCPIKLTQPWELVEAGNGAMAFRQWDSTDPAPEPLKP